MAARARSNQEIVESLQRAGVSALGTPAQKQSRDSRKQRVKLEDIKTAAREAIKR